MVSSEGTCAAFFSAGRGLGGARSPLPVTPLVQIAPIGGSAAAGPAGETAP
jgi:hypothetical protein